MSGVLGESIRRREDPALVTGRGKYTDDLVRPGMVFATIVRSPYAHATINSIDASEALAMPGVLAVYTGHDITDGEAGGVVPTCWLLPNLKTPDHPILAKDRVRHVGDGVAVVVAEDRYVARDAADLVYVDYEPEDAVTDVAAALEEGAPLVHADVPGNLAFDWDLGDAEKTAQAFEGAAHVVSLDLINNRLIPHAIEPRAALAEFDVRAARSAIDQHAARRRRRCGGTRRTPNQSRTG
ncbi:MAG: hypothetical protein AAFX50_16180, partial [Acidobacteriota bacterium]